MNYCIGSRSWRRPLGLDDGPRKAVTQHHAGLKPASALAILRWQRRMEQALTGLKGQGMPSTRAEAPGLRAYGEPVFTLIACSAGWRDTTRRNALPDVPTIGLVTACESLHDVRDTGGL
jgi:hypothetical protein